MQLRSLDDHQPLFGVIVADIGVKFGNGGYNTMDNDLLRLDHVRIPRDNMLMRFSLLFQHTAQVSILLKYIRLKYSGFLFAGWQK